MAGTCEATESDAECLSCKLTLSNKEELIKHVQEVHKLSLPTGDALDELDLEDLDSSQEIEFRITSTENGCSQQENEQNGTGGSGVMEQTNVHNSTEKECLLDSVPLETPANVNSAGLSLPNSLLCGLLFDEKSDRSTATNPENSCQAQSESSSSLVQTQNLTASSENSSSPSITSRQDSSKQIVNNVSIGRIQNLSPFQSCPTSDATVSEHSETACNIVVKNTSDAPSTTLEPSPNGNTLCTSKTTSSISSPLTNLVTYSSTLSISKKTAQGLASKIKEAVAHIQKASNESDNSSLDNGINGQISNDSHNTDTLFTDYRTNEANNETDTGEAHTQKASNGSDSSLLDNGLNGKISNDLHSTVTLFTNDKTSEASNETAIGEAHTQKASNGPDSSSLDNVVNGQISNDSYRTDTSIADGGSNETSIQTAICENSRPQNNTNVISSNDTNGNAQLGTPINTQPSDHLPAVSESVNSSSKDSNRNVNELNTQVNIKGTSGIKQINLAPVLENFPSINSNNNNLSKDVSKSIEVVVISDDEEITKLPNLNGIRVKNIKQNHKKSPQKSPNRSISRGRGRLVTNFQNFLLEKFYKENPNPSVDDKKKLSIKIGLNLNLINDWLTNRVFEEASPNENVLNGFFKVNQYPTLEERQTLAKALGVTVESVRIWFLRKRLSHRKNARRLSFEQSGTLFEFFKHTPFPSTDEYLTLARKLNLSLNTVTQWFQCKRRENHFSKEIVSSCRARAIKDFLQRDPNPSDSDLFHLAKNLRMTVSKIKVWIRKQGLRKKRASGEFSDKEDKDSETCNNTRTASTHDGLSSKTTDRIVTSSTSTSSTQCENSNRSSSRNITVSNKANKPVPHSDISFSESRIANNTSQTHGSIKAEHYSIKSCVDVRNSLSHNANKYNLTENQLIELLQHFQRNPNPSLSDMKLIARLLGAPTDAVVYWYSEKLQNYQNDSKSMLTLTSVKTTDPTKIKGRNKLGKFYEQRLMEYYRKNPAPSAVNLSTLAQELNLTFVKVLSWFWAVQEGRSPKIKHKQPKSGQIIAADNEKLKVYYEINKYPSVFELQELSDWLNVTVEHIKLWFHFSRKRDFLETNDKGASGDATSTTESASESDITETIKMYVSDSSDYPSSSASDLSLSDLHHKRNPVNNDTNTKLSVLSIVGLPQQARTKLTFYFNTINQTPNSKEIALLACKCGIKKRIIKMWFANERKKLGNKQGKSGDHHDTSLSSLTSGNVMPSMAIDKKNKKISNATFPCNPAPYSYKSLSDVLLDRFSRLQDTNEQTSENEELRDSNPGMNHQSESSAAHNESNSNSNVVKLRNPCEHMESVNAQCNLNMASRMTQNKTLRSLQSMVHQYTGPAGGSLYGQPAVDERSRAESTITLDKYNAVREELNNIKNPTATDIGLTALKFKLTVGQVISCVDKEQTGIPRQKESTHISSTPTVAVPERQERKSRHSSNIGAMRKRKSEDTMESVPLPGQKYSVEKFFMSSEPREVQAWANYCGLTKGEVFSAWGAFRQNIQLVINTFDPYYSNDKLTIDQRKQLLEKFKTNQMPSDCTVKEIACSMFLKADHVETWFSQARNNLYLCCVALGGQSIVNMTEKYTTELQKKNLDNPNLKKGRDETVLTYYGDSVDVFQVNNNTTGNDAIQQPNELQNIPQSSVPNTNFTNMQEKGNNNALNMQDQSYGTQPVLLNANFSNQSINAMERFAKADNQSRFHRNVNVCNASDYINKEVFPETGGINTGNGQQIARNIQSESLPWSNQGQFSPNNIHVPTADVHLGTKQRSVSRNIPNRNNINMQLSMGSTVNIPFQKAQYPALACLYDRTDDGQNVPTQYSSEGDLFRNQDQRPRTAATNEVFSAHEKSFLQDMYRNNPNPSMDQAENVANALGKDITAIVQWYKEARMKRSVVTQFKLEMPNQQPIVSNHSTGTGPGFISNNTIRMMKFENPFLNDYSMQQADSSENLQLRISNVESASQNNVDNIVIAPPGNVQSHSSSIFYDNSEGTSEASDAVVLRSPDSTTQPRSRREYRSSSGKNWHCSADSANFIVIDDSD